MKGTLSKKRKVALWISSILALALFVISMNQAVLFHKAPGELKINHPAFHQKAEPTTLKTP